MPTAAAAGWNRIRFTRVAPMDTGTADAHAWRQQQGPGDQDEQHTSQHEQSLTVLYLKSS
jgi:hypothetical protein